MNRVKLAIALETIGLLIFTILCATARTVPSGLLILFLLALQAGLVWMVVTILKHGTPSTHTFDERFYDKP